MSSLSQRPRDERLVVGITGRIGSGKTSAGRYLSSRYGFQYLRYSQVLAEWLVAGPGTERKGHLQEIGLGFITKGMQTQLKFRRNTPSYAQADDAIEWLR